MKARTAALVALILTACDRPPDLPADARVSFDTVNGTIHVVSGNRGSWVRGGSWTVPDSGVVIGVLDGAPEYVFGQVAGVVVDDAGNIWVADTQAKELRVFDREGAFVRRVGREGEGPGEFRNLSGLALAPEGVGALDGQLGRVTVFGPGGEVVRSFRLARPYMILEHGAAMGFDDQGRFFDRGRFSIRPPVDSLGVVTYSRGGQPVDTAMVAVIEEDQLIIERNGVRYMSVPRPFSPRPVLAFGPDGTIHFARGDAYRIEVLSPTGDTIRVLRREIRPRPVTPEEREAALDQLDEWFADAGARVPPGTELPGTRPVIGRLIVDAAGNLWVLNPPDPSWQSLEWWVHDRAGRYLGAVATPAMDVMQIGEDFVAGVVTDDMGVARVKVVPIVKPRGR